MNTENPNINTTALSEIDRLGQRALDAIWAEEASYNGNRKQIDQLLKGEAATTDPEGTLQRAAQLLGVEGHTETMRAMLDTWQKGTERQQAVNEYVMARRLLSSVL